MYIKTAYNGFITAVILMAVLATSTGSRDGLLNADGGACYHHNMKLIISVCCRSSSSKLSSVEFNILCSPIFNSK